MKKINFFLVGLAGLIIPFSCSDNSTNEQEPKAIFAIDPQSGKVGDDISFINYSEESQDYTWSYGDGITSNLENPTHIYTMAGSYKVILYAGIDKNADMIVNHMDDADSASQIIHIDHNITSVELTIKDGTAWTIENPGLTIVEGARVSLYSDQSFVNIEIPDYSGLSDVTGKIVFYDIPAGTYYMTSGKNNLSNIVNGYLITGVFQNQQEIDSYAAQPDATVGGLKFSDVNADGIISTKDFTDSDQIIITGTATLNRDVVIGN